MKFSILFWNIWLDNQLDGMDGAGTLLDELARIVEEYQPDFIGLNEVLKDPSAKSPFVFDYLHELGYKYNHFALASPLNEKWLIGAGLCSRYKPTSSKDIVLSGDTPAARRGHPDETLKAAAATVAIGNKDINIVVAHPMHLRPYTLKDHYQGTETLNQLLRSDEFSKNTVLGGDFNEPVLMPKAFKHKVRDIMNMRTGTWQNPTWRMNASPSTIIRANIDQLYWSKNSEFALEHFEILNSSVSDHRPLLASFKI